MFPAFFDRPSCDSIAIKALAGILPLSVSDASCNIPTTEIPIECYLRLSVKPGIGEFPFQDSERGETCREREAPELLGGFPDNPSLALP